MREFVSADQVLPSATGDQPTVLSDVLAPLIVIDSRIATTEGLLSDPGLSNDTIGPLGAKLQTLRGDRDRLTRLLGVCIGAAQYIEDNLGLELPKYPEIAAYLGGAITAEDIETTQVLPATTTRPPFPPPVPTINPMEALIAPVTPTAEEAKEIEVTSESLVREVNEYLNGHEIPLEKQLEFMQKFWRYLGYEVPRLSANNITALEKRLKAEPNSIVILSPLAYGFGEYMKMVNSEQAKSLIRVAVSPGELGSYYQPLKPELMTEYFYNEFSGSELEEPAHGAGPHPENSRTSTLGFNNGTVDEDGNPAFFTFAEYKRQMQKTGLLIAGQGEDARDWTLSTISNRTVNYSEGEKRIIVPRLEDTPGIVATAMLLCGSIGRRGTHLVQSDNLRGALTNVAGIDYIFRKMAGYYYTMLIWDPNSGFINANIGNRDIDGKLTPQNEKGIRVWI